MRFVLFNSLPKIFCIFFKQKNYEGKITTCRKRPGGPDISPPAQKKPQSDKTVPKAMPAYQESWPLQEVNPNTSPVILQLLKNNGHIPVDSYFYGTIKGKTIGTEVVELTLKVNQKLVFKLNSLFLY